MSQRSWIGLAVVALVLILGFLLWPGGTEDAVVAPEDAVEEPAEPAAEPADEPAEEPATE